MLRSIDQVLDAVIPVLSGQKLLSEVDLLFIRPHIRLRAQHGVTAQEALEALRIVHRGLWDAVLEAADDDDHGRTAALSLARPLLEFFDALSRVSSEAFIEVYEAMTSQASDVRRNLLEDLLAGREPAPGRKLSAARAAGIDQGAPVAVIAAVPLESPPDDTALPVAVRALAHAGDPVVEPLAVLRQEEIVIVRATREHETARLAEALNEVRVRLASDGLRLAIGLSGLREGLTDVRAAYDEACLAIEHAKARGQVVAIATLSAFQYLLLRGADSTAWRLVPATVRRFVEEDASQACLLTKTLLAYLESDMNVKLAAERLFVHPNTAHYRLAKIEEQTGCDLRRLDDLTDLLVAIRLKRAMQ